MYHRKFMAGFLTVLFVVFGSFAENQPGKDELSRDRGRLRILAPNGGEMLVAGSEFEVRWELNYQGGADSLQIRLIKSEGAEKKGYKKEVLTTLTSLTKGDPGRWTWRDVNPVSDNLRIEVQAYYRERILIVDESDKPFAVTREKQKMPEDDIPTAVPTELRVLSPNGGEVWAETTTAKIRWLNPYKDRKDNGLGKFKVLLSRDGGETYPTLIAEDLPSGVDECEWTVEAPPSINCRIKVVWVPAPMLPAFVDDESEADFQILAGLTKPLPKKDR